MFRRLKCKVTPKVTVERNGEVYEFVCGKTRRTIFFGFSNGSSPMNHRVRMTAKETICIERLRLNGVRG